MTEDNNKVLAKVGDKEVRYNDVVNFISQMDGGQQFMTPQGINQIAEELVNQELLYIQAKKDGLDKDEEYLKEVEFTKENMLKNYALHKLFLGIEVSEKDIKDYYDKNQDMMKSPVYYKAKHILVKEEELANSIYEEIVMGKSFEDAANEYSIDNHDKNGGDLGEFPAGTMVKEFEDVLNQLKEGEVSKPVKTQFGYHLIKLDHKHDSHVASLEEVKDRIYQTLLMIRRQERYLEQTDKIKKDVKVERFF